MIQLDGLIKVLFVLILITAAYIMTRRDILSIISTYSVQSFLIAVLALVLFLKGGPKVLLSLAVITILSKALLIPAVMRTIQKRIKVNRDVEYTYLSANGILILGLVMVLTSYLLLAKLLGGFALSKMFLFGAVAGISLTLMGNIVIFGRKHSIIKIVGYLTMENGVLLMSLFLAELPLLIEVLIIVDLVSLILLLTILSFRLSSDLNRMNDDSPFAWPEGDDK
jgi:hydrogenase-4 component E